MKVEHLDGAGEYLHVVDSKGKSYAHLSYQRLYQRLYKASYMARTGLKSSRAEIIVISRLSRSRG